MNRKPRVVFIMHLPPPVHGAAMMGQYIKNSKLINETFDCTFVNESLSSSVSEVGSFNRKKILNLICHLRNIRSLLKECRPDLVYMTPGGIPGMGIIRYYLESKIINQFNCRKIIHFHNKGTKEKSEKWYMRWYYKVLFKNSHVILLSKYLTNQYETILSSKDISICPNGISEIETDLVKSTNVVPHILFLSNLIPDKGVLVLLDALSILKSKNIKFVGDVVGSESKGLDKNTFIQEIDKRNLQDCVVYHGPKYGKDKDAFFCNSDIFAFPTYYKGECFPLVLLEAMRYSLPCVSTYEGGIRDIIQDGYNGFLCKQKDSLSLAVSLQRLIEDADMRNVMGNNGRQLFLKKFTQQHFEKNICDILYSQTNV